MEEQIKYYRKMGWKIVGVIFILLGIFAVYKMGIFYMPFLIAWVIASIAEPLIKWIMKHWKWKRKLASSTALLLIVSILVLILAILASNIISESIRLIENLNGYATKAYQDGMKLLSDIQEGRIEIPSEVMQMAQKSYGTLLEGVKTVLGNFFTGVLSTLSSIPTWLTYGFITILAVIFICFDREYLGKMCEKHIPKVWMENIKGYGKTTMQVGVTYLKAEVKLSGACFLLMLIGLNALSILGISIEYPVIMAIFIGFVDLLPIFGAGTVMIPWAIYFALTGNMTAAIAVGILWIVWAVIKNLLEPKMISHQMGLHPIFTLLAMYTGFKCFGVLGLMLGPICLTILIHIFSDYIDKGILKTIFEKE